MKTQNQFPLWSSLVMSKDLPVLRRMFGLIMKRNCHDLVVEIVIGWFIYMSIGGPSGRGHSRKRSRGARTGQGAVMTNVPRGK